MVVNTANMKVLQVQIPHELNGFLDEVAAKTHVAKSVIVRMGVERIIQDIKEGKVQLGIRFG